MNRLCSYLTSLGLGAGAMYFWDPELGSRRRSLARDRCTRSINEFRCALDKTMRDLENRVYGLYAETRACIQGDQATDEVLVDRVRSKMGRYCSHPSAVEVSAEAGRITLSGPVLADEVQELVRAVRSVRGVTGVDNRLDSHATPAGVSALQGGSPPAGEPFEWQQEVWSPSMKLAAGTAVVFGIASLAIRPRPIPILLGAVAGAWLWGCKAETAGATTAPPQPTKSETTRPDGLDDMVDEAVEESFPASDPPSYTGSAITSSAPPASNSSQEPY